MSSGLTAEWTVRCVQNLSQSSSDMSCPSCRLMGHLVAWQESAEEASGCPWPSSPAVPAAGVPGSVPAAVTGPGRGSSGSGSYSAIASPAASAAAAAVEAITEFDCH